jgi:hypothetical protein
MQAKILRALILGPSSISELIEFSGGSYCAIRNYIKALRNEKLIRVADYETAPNGARVIPLFEWAPDRSDAKQPRTAAYERQRQYRARKKARVLEDAWRASASASIHQPTFGAYSHEEGTPFSKSPNTP